MLVPTWQYKEWSRAFFCIVCVIILWVCGEQAGWLQQKASPHWLLRGAIHPYDSRDA